MSWGAQNRSEDAKTPSAAGVWSENPELDLWPIQPYLGSSQNVLKGPRL
jgi:hypothetical protein